MTTYAIPDQPLIPRLVGDPNSRVAKLLLDLPEGAELHAVENDNSYAICGKELGPDVPLATGLWEERDSSHPACGTCDLSLTRAPLLTD